jgi:hypothetical protein
MTKRHEIDLTGTRLHRALRNLAAEATPDYVKRQERRAAYDRDFDRCEHGGDKGECAGGHR